MESPGKVSERAFEMVLQACWRDSQLLLSLPCFPSTYQLLLARAVGKAANSVSVAKHISFVNFIFCSYRRETTLSWNGLVAQGLDERVRNGCVFEISNAPQGVRDLAHLVKLVPLFPRIRTGRDVPALAVPVLDQGLGDS